MDKNISRRFNDLLLSNNFVKHKKYYFRIINNNVFQTIGLVYKANLWHLTFDSIILDVVEDLETMLKFLELVHDGYDIASLLNQENSCYSKEQAMAILNEEIIYKLNELKDVKTHLNFFENELFVDDGAICSAPYLYYLYNNDYERAEYTYSEILDVEIDRIVSWRLDDIIWKERRTKNEFVLEQMYKQYLNDKEMLVKIRNKESFTEYFNNNYLKNIKIIKNYYGEKKLKKFGALYVKN